MLRKRLGLSTEPQPVFVGASFALLMLLMQIYVITLTNEGKLVAMFNNPKALFATMMGITSKTSFAVWLLKTAVPMLMIICAAVYGKNKAKLLFIPCLPALLYIVLGFVGGTLITYRISYGVYFATTLFYVLTSLDVIKSVKPFIVYCALVCIVILVLTALKQPPFTLYDGSLYISDMLYFIIYHIVILNFARAIPMQKHI